MSGEDLFTSGGGATDPDGTSLMILLEGGGPII